MTWSVHLYQSSALVKSVELQPEALERRNKLDSFASLK